MKILVTGATGNIGKLAVPRLLEQGHGVRVLTRSPYKLKEMAEKVEVAEGSLLDKDCLGPACEGIEVMFLLTPHARGETEQGLNGVAAAKAAGIKRVVYLTVHNLEGAPQVPHFGSKIPVKEALCDSGVEYTFIEPNSFFQSDLFIEDPLRLFNIYPQPLGGIGANRVDVRDIAESVVHALTQDGHAGKTYPLVGPDVLTGEDCARIWGQYREADVQYIGDDLDNWEKQAEVMMLPWIAHDLRIMYEHFQAKGFWASGEDHARCEDILGHAPRRFNDFVAEIAPEWK